MNSQTAEHTMSQFKPRKTHFSFQLTGMSFSSVQFTEVRDVHVTSYSYGYWLKTRKRDNDL